MRCARCHRQITQASVTAGGMVFGPTCARIMNLVQPVQPSQQTQHRAIKREAKGVFLNRTFEAQDGQFQLFEWMTA